MKSLVLMFFHFQSKNQNPAEIIQVVMQCVFLKYLLSIKFLHFLIL